MMFRKVFNPMPCCGGDGLRPWLPSVAMLQLSDGQGRHPLRRRRPFSGHCLVRTAWRVMVVGSWTPQTRSTVAANLVRAALEAMTSIGVSRDTSTCTTMTSAGAADCHRSVQHPQP